MQEDQDNLIEKVRAVYGFKVNNGPQGQTGYWVIDAKQGKGKVIFNGTRKWPRECSLRIHYQLLISVAEKCDVTFVISDDDVFELLTGKLPPQKAFFQGKIKIQGNMGFAMKLMDLQRSAQGRIAELRSKL